MRCFIYCRKSSESEDRQILSIDAQEAEIRRAFGNHADIEIIAVYRESYSAKAPGRPVFNDMLARIERGEADAIIAWHPDRLARNSVDGGHIVYLLDRGQLQDLKFATFTFENNPQGKFMLAITFGYSKYYVDSLSQNVKRGNRAKIEQGWRPNMAPIGYRNDRESKTIVKDPEHYPYVRKIYEHMLTGVYTVSQIVKIANDEWGYRTPKRKRMGGGPLRPSTAYNMLANPFYAGYILWGGQLHPGKHEPVVSLAEFERVQELLGRPCRPKAVRRTFAYTGLIRCGACGLQVTAEHKVNRYGSHYVYYHCTRVHRTPACMQPSIEAAALDAQIRSHLRALTIPEAVHRWLLQQLGAAKTDRVRDHEVHVHGLERTEAAIRSQISNLTDLRVRGLIDDDEFCERRRALQGDLYGIQEKLREAHIAPVAFEPEKILVMFRYRAISWFDSGDCEARRMILQILGSNPTLKDKKLSIQAKNPFRLDAEPTSIASLLADLDDVRTLESVKLAVQRWLHEIGALVAQRDPELLKMLESIQELDAMFSAAPPEDRLAA